MKLKLISILLFVITLLHATLTYNKIYVVHNFLGVFTMPIILCYYLISTGKKYDIRYLLGVLFIFVGDAIITFSYKGNLKISLIFFGIGYLIYSALLLSRIRSIKSKNILKVSIPFLIIYLIPNLYFSLYLDVASFVMQFHNTAIGLFICIAILKVVNENSIKANFYVCLSGLFLFLMILFSGYEMFVRYNAFIATYVVMFCFALGNYFLAVYFARIAKLPKRIKQ